MFRKTLDFWIETLFHTQAFNCATDNMLLSITIPKGYKLLHDEQSMKFSRMQDDDSENVYNRHF
jgi:hypothetical protein